MNDQPIELLDDFVAAYRFQLTPTDDFDAAARLVPYFASLGVSHLYLSPIAEAEPGSIHGYDIVDPNVVRNELGGIEAFDRLCAELTRHGIGIVLDIVPNHLSIATPELNPWFWHVLRNGRSSPYGEAFDIDWEAADGAVVLPVLSGPLDDEVAAMHVVEGRDGPILVLDSGLRLPVSDRPHEPGRAALLALLEAQPYRLVAWQSDERNQRRFFEIDSLAGVAVEHPEIRRERHRLLARLLERHPALLAGVRVDHVDGLADPDDYLTWLRRLIGPHRLLLVEKILIGSERLPERWPVDGTTGYEFARLVDQLLVDPEGLVEMRAVWTELTGDDVAYHDTERASVEEVLRDRLHPEVQRLHRLVDDVPELAGPEGIDAIVALATHLDRYRTYLPHGGPADVALIMEAARRAGSGSDAGVDAVGTLAGLLTRPGSESHRRAQTLFQQLTGPALAKGAEDRALYRHLPLAALNEVGGDPGTGGADPDDFHRWAADAATNHPCGLLTTSTHDTKRSGDVRARLLALSHHRDLWRSFATSWVPLLDIDPADALLLLQSVVGAWPIDEGRLGDYLTKALREAALRSSWIEPDTDYETAVVASATALLADPAFTDEVDRLVAVLAPRADTNSLVHALLRFTAPGFGDLYRGTEIQDLSLVDPDNRRPVDWEALILAVADSDPLDVVTARASSVDLAKLALIRRTLACRSARPLTNDYEPLPTTDDRILAFRRGHLVVVVDLDGRSHTVGAGSPTNPAPATVTLPNGAWWSVLRAGGSLHEGEVGLDQVLDGGLSLDLLTDLPPGSPSPDIG